MDRPSELVGVRFAEPLVPARFIRRLNRFAALVRVEGREERVHVRNSGRLREILTPNRRTDPAFAAALERAARAGVRVRALTYQVTRRGVRLGRCVPVRLPSARTLGPVGKSCPAREMG